MASHKEAESVEVQLARIDMRVEHIHESLPLIIKKVNQHDRDILAAKVVAGIGLIIVALWHPSIVEAIGSILK